MRNLILYQTHIQKLLENSNNFAIAYYLDEFSKLIIIIDSEFKILLFSYENLDVFSNFTMKQYLELELLLGVNSEGIDFLNELMSESEGRELDYQNSPIKFLMEYVKTYSKNFNQRV